MPQRRSSTGHAPAMSSIVKPLSGSERIKFSFRLNLNGRSSNQSWHGMGMGHGLCWEGQRHFGNICGFFCRTGSLNVNQTVEKNTRLTLKNKQGACKHKEQPPYTFRPRCSMLVCTSIFT